MYCKKCGTEQKEGQKFCPKCGEPFVEVNEKPHTGDFKQYAQKGIDEFKKIDWNEKKEQTSSIIKEFINNPNKIGLATKVVTCLFTLWILIKTGFSVSIFGYILLAAIIYVAFKGIPKIKLEGLKAQYASTAFCLILMLLIGWGSTSDGSNKSSDGLFGSFSNSSGPREICVTLQAETDVGYGPQGRMKNILSSSGNYGFKYDEGRFYTDDIIVPEGKVWVYKDYEVNYNGGEGCVPDIRHYYMGIRKEKYNSYDCRKQARNIPAFRGGDKIKVVVLRYGEDKRKTNEIKVYFIEKDDDLQTSN